MPVRVRGGEALQQRCGLNVLRSIRSRSLRFYIGMGYTPLEPIWHQRNPALQLETPLDQA